MDGPRPPVTLSRRSLLSCLLACSSLQMTLPIATASAAKGGATDATFVFAADIHACRMGSGLSPHCAAEGKTDGALRRHIAALNRLPELRWPREVGGAPSGLARRARRSASPSAW